MDCQKYSCKYDANCIEFFINGKVVYETDEKTIYITLGMLKKEYIGICDIKIRCYGVVSRGEINVIKIK